MPPDEESATWATCPGCDEDYDDDELCATCKKCDWCCECDDALFDADELGLDPEEDHLEGGEREQDA